MIARPPIAARRPWWARLDGAARAGGKRLARSWWLLVPALSVVLLALPRPLPAPIMLASAGALAVVVVVVLAFSAFPGPKSPQDQRVSAPGEWAEDRHTLPGDIPISEQVTRSIPSGGPIALPRRRIVFLINSTGFGGATQHSLNVASELQRLGLDVLLVLPPGAPVLAQASARGLPIREMRLGRNIGRWRGVLGTLTYLNPLDRRRSIQQILALQREHPSIFICPFPREQLLTTSIRPEHDIRSVWVVHAPFSYRAHRLLLQRAWIARAARAHAVVAVSKGLGTQLLRAGVPGGQLEIIANAVALPDPGSAGQVTREPLLIGTAARLVKAKGIQHMIAAMPVILREQPQARLAIAGRGNYERALRRQVARLGLGEHVTFLGYVPESRSFLARLQVLAHPSVDPGEVLPTVILEALSVGTPVVGSALAGIPDTVIDGETGFLTPPGDVAGLAHAVGVLLEAPERASAMGENGRRLLAREFLLSRAGRRFAQLLHLVDDQPTRRHDQVIESISTAVLSTIRQRHLLGSSAIVLASKLLSALATAWWTVLAARLLLPTEYGDLAIAVSLVQLGSYLADAGVQTVATRDLALAAPRHARALMGSVVYLKLVLGIAGVGIVFGFTSLLPFDISVSRLVLVVGPGLIFSGLSSLTLVFRVRGTYGYLLPIAFVGAAASSVATYIAYLTRGGVFVFAAINLGATVLTGLITAIIVLIRFQPSLRPRPQQLGKLLRTALPLGLAAILNILYYRIDVPLLGLLTSSTQVAIYTSAYRFLDVLTLLPASLQAVSLPHMSTLYKQGIKSLTNYAQSYLDLAVIGGPTLGLVLSISAQPALHLLYGGRYDVAAPTLHILAWAGAATLVTNVFVPLMIAINKSRSMIVVTMVGLAVNFGLNFLLIPRLGSLGSAYATLVTELAVTAVMVPICVRTLRWRIRLDTLIGVGVAIVLIEWVASRPALQALSWPLTLVLLLALWGVLMAITIAVAWLRRKGRRSRALGFSV